MAIRTHEQLKDDAVVCMNRIADMCKGTIEQYRQVYGVDSVWLAVDGNGDVWAYGVEPVWVSSGCNNGYWQGATKELRAFRASRVPCPKMGFAPHLKTECVK